MDPYNFDEHDYTESREHQYQDYYLRQGTRICNISLKIMLYFQ